MISKELQNVGKQPEKQIYGWTEFLETVPPGISVKVVGVCVFDSGKYRVQHPDLKLYCDSMECNGIRNFYYHGHNQFIVESSREIFHMTYYCRNCVQSSKIYSLMIRLLPNEEGDEEYTVTKIGELPPLGPYISKKVLKFIDKESDLFYKARRSESQGFGIGAFTYYRRVVENLKNKLIGKIILVANQLNTSKEVITKFEDAKKEHQFTRAIEQIKDFIPEKIYIKTHNPFTLLHQSLSRDIHGASDLECLELATTIRLVLTKFIENINHVLKDEKELTEAVSKILKTNKK